MARSLLPAAVALVIAARGAAADDLRVDVSLVGASLAISDRNGAGVATEIKVARGRHLELGGRVDIAVMFGGAVGGATLPFGLAAAALAKVDYRPGGGAVRPFVGLGAGVYSMGSHTIVTEPDGTTGVSTTSGRYLGVAPSLGLTLGRLRLAATYHAIRGTSVEYRQTSGGVAHREAFAPSYLSLELGGRFAGAP